MKLVQTVTPVEPLIQKVVHRVYCPIYLSLYASILLFMESVMVRFDFKCYAKYLIYLLIFL
jgi:hypothetical protein